MRGEIAETEEMNRVTMTDAQRKLYLMILSGYEPYHAITQAIYFLYANFPRNKLDAALRWLASNNLTGKRFMDWLNYECSASYLEMHRALLAAVEKNEKRPIIFRKDFNA